LPALGDNDLVGRSPFLLSTDRPQNVHAPFAHAPPLLPNGMIFGRTCGQHHAEIPAGAFAAARPLSQAADSHTPSFSPRRRWRSATIRIGRNAHNGGVSGMNRDAHFFAVLI